jgi:hypothetical protein
VANGENPVMNTVKPPCLDAAGDALAKNPRVLELFARNHPVLTGGEPGN